MTLESPFQSRSEALDFLNSLSAAEQSDLLAHLEQERLTEAKDSLKTYARFIEIPGAPLNDDEESELFYIDRVTPARHHDLVLDVCQDMAFGKHKRVMIFGPPGMAKSTYASVVFPTWFMGKFPRSSIIGASYASDLAKKFGRKCRFVARSERYSQLFQTALRADTTAVDDWALDNASDYMAGGFLSGITGNRADGVVMDDPIKGRAEADSDTIRDKVYNTYIDDIRTRLKPRAWQLLIMTRWHEDDLAGRILPESYAGETGLIRCRDGFDWYVICLPAEAGANDPLGRAPGEMLWSDWFIADELRVIKANNPRTWSSLYQQRPAPEEGSFFKREWFKYYSKLPEGCRFYGASDYAVTADGGDYTVHIVVAVDKEGNIYVEDLWREQTESDQWIEALLDLIQKHKPLKWAEEQGQIIKSVGPFLTRRMRERKAFCAREQFTSATDKPTRARSIQARWSQGMVYLKEGAPWLADLISELLAFDAGKNDDQVDTLSLIGRLLDTMTGRTPEKPKPDKDRWDQAFDKAERQEASSWKTL
jgi:predicted phage terminase large subunit-like protein